MKRCLFGDNCFHNIEYNTQKKIYNRLVVFIFFFFFFFCLTDRIDTVFVVFVEANKGCIMGNIGD